MENNNDSNPITLRLLDLQNADRTNTVGTSIVQQLTTRMDGKRSGCGKARFVKVEYVKGHDGKPSYQLTLQDVNAKKIFNCKVKDGNVLLDKTEKYEGVKVFHQEMLVLFCWHMLVLLKNKKGCDKIKLNLCNSNSTVGV